MIVFEELRPDDKLTEEQIEMPEKAAKIPITFDEGCPELTDEQLAKFTHVSVEKYRKKNVL